MARPNVNQQQSSRLGGNLGKQTAASFYHMKLTVFVSLLSWPVTYICNNAFQQIDQTARPFWMMAAGFAILVGVVAAVAMFSYVNDWMYYGAVLFAFTAVIDLIITLEFNGVIHNFMSEYLKLGEPYLASSWGSAIALFDGIGFYLMYLLLVHLISNGKSWRSVGIYWSAGIINSMIVLVFGIFTGKHSPTFCTFMNIPYVLLPIVAAIRAFKHEERPSWTNKTTSSLKLIDLVFASAILGSIYITLGKGFTALATGNPTVDFLGFLPHEPSFLLDDPAPFATIQAIVYLLYLLPLQIISVYYCLMSEKPNFLWEITLIQAGAMLQGQFSVLGLALDPQTPISFQTAWLDGYFWFYNLLILIVPHLLLLRLCLQNKNGLSNPKPNQKLPKKTS